MRAVARLRHSHLTGKITHWNCSADAINISTHLRVHIEPYGSLANQVTGTMRAFAGELALSAAIPFSISCSVIGWQSSFIAQKHITGPSGDRTASRASRRLLSWLMACVLRIF